MVFAFQFLINALKNMSSGVFWSFVDCVFVLKFWISVIRKFGATIIFFNLDGGTTQKREGSDSGKKIVTENVKLKVFSDSFSPIYLKNCH